MKNTCIAWSGMLILFLLSCHSGDERTTSTIHPIIDEIFQDWKADEPGGAVAIIEKGELIYENYFGLAATIVKISSILWS